MNKDLILTLQNYWFSEKEAKIYLTALSLWAAPASTIARNANESRTTVYSILWELVKKWMFSTLVRENVTYFSPISPETLENIYKQKYITLHDKIPELMALSSIWQYKPQMLVYEWLEWIKKVYLDTLNYPNSVLKAFYWHATAVQNMKKRWIALEYRLDNIYMPKRIENKILAKVLLSWDKEVDKPYVDLIQIWDNAKYTQYQYHGSENLKLSNEINLYGWDKIMTSVISENEMWWVIIKSQTLYDTFDALFDLIWKR